MLVKPEPSPVVLAAAAAYQETENRLLPGEKRTVTIETESANLKGGDALVVMGWNAASQRFAVSQ